jgi:hypothetical protein
MAFIERLRKQTTDGKEPSTNVNIAQGAQPVKPTSTTPELELFDKTLQLKDELRAFRTNNLKNRELVQVYAPLNPAGKKVGIFGQHPIYFGIRTVAIALVILIIFESYRWIGRYEKEKSNRKA